MRFPLLSPSFSPLSSSLLSLFFTSAHCLHLLYFLPFLTILLGNQNYDKKENCSLLSRVSETRNQNTTPPAHKNSSRYEVRIKKENRP